MSPFFYSEWLSLLWTLCFLLWLSTFTFSRFFFLCQPKAMLRNLLIYVFPLQNSILFSFLPTFLSSFGWTNRQWKRLGCVFNPRSLCSVWLNQNLGTRTLKRREKEKLVRCGLQDVQFIVVDGGIALEQRCRKISCARPDSPALMVGSGRTRLKLRIVLGWIELDTIYIAWGLSKTWSSTVTSLVPRHR